MKRNVTMEEISDGRLYRENDMVKADCQDCKGCSRCCHDMVDTIILSPFDIRQMREATGKTLQELLEKEVKLSVVNGMVLPNLKMTEERNCCAFLDENGRCSIHKFRPDLCRLFPLGRVYKSGDFQYFLQTDQCDHARTKIKVSKWIDMPAVREHKAYILRWHDLLDRVEELLWDSGDDTFKKNLNMAVLNLFFMKPYETEQDFYGQFSERVKQMETVLSV